MQFETAFKYPFEDKEWATKGLIGVVISLVPVLNFAASGYMTDIIRNVARGDAEPMPRWDDLGGLFMKGLYVFLAQIVYSLPGMFVMFVGFFPFIILPLLGTVDEDLMVGASIVATISVMCIALLGVFLMVAANLMMLAGWIRFSLGKQEINEFFELEANWQYLRDNIGQVLLAVLLIMVFGFVIMLPIFCITMVLSFIPFCGPLLAFIITLPISFYLMLFSAHIYGQLARVTGLTSHKDVVEGEASPG